MGVETGLLKAMHPGVRWAIVLMLLSLVASACGGQVAGPTPAPSTPGATNTLTASSSTPASGADAAGIVWLCIPGKANNPCEAKLTTTVIDSSGKRMVETLTPAADPPIDCFYVYPTFSKQQTKNADLSIDPELVTIATWQAAPFSQVCKVYAPVYPQMTIAGLSSGATSDMMFTAYAGVYSAFDDYLANYNHGRGIVFLGHSQGAMHLITLLQDWMDNRPEVRKLLVSAMILGGSATTASGEAAGGSFANIPTCASAAQTGCVFGYSSFSETPPEDAAFGRLATATGIQGPTSGMQLMCVNPVAPGGKGTYRLPLIASSDLPRLTADPPNPLPETTFVSYPNAYTAECMTDGNATWLQVTRIDPKGAAPVLAGTEGRAWGLHDFDVSLPLGNLLDLVRAESAAYKP